MIMSTTESAQIMVADDNKDLVTAQWASAVWWNGYQQLPLPAAVHNFNCDYSVPYDTTGCEDNSCGPYYGVPMVDTSANPWPAQSAADEEELYAITGPVSSVVDHHYKYPTTPQAAVDYAMLECYAAVADPVSVTGTPWTSIPYADTTSRVSGYEVCCSAPVPAVSMDYCNSLQMMQYGSYSMPVMNQADDVVDHSSFDKTASTYMGLI